MKKGRCASPAKPITNNQQPITNNQLLREANERCAAFGAYADALRDRRPLQIVFTSAAVQMLAIMESRLTPTVDPNGQSRDQRDGGKVDRGLHVGGEVVPDSNEIVGPGKLPRQAQ